MRKAFVTSVQAALFAAALSGCNEQTPTGAVNSAPKVARDDRVVALNTLKAATEAKQAGVAGDMVTELAEDQAAFDGVIQKLKARMTKKVPAGAATGELNAKEKRP